MPPNSVRVTCTAPVNIAVVKYWGKRDETLILPTNSSLSGTIDKGSMQSKTTITASQSLAHDEMFLNDKPVKLENDKRIYTVVKQLRARAQDVKDSNGRVVLRKEEWGTFKLSIVSHNNFPTAAGLASSASGLACLTSALAALFNAKEKFTGEFSMIARQGSGSACRSLFGGFVKWNMGTKADGSDSMAVQVAPASHWPDMRVLILVCGAGPKKVPSTRGMAQTVATSDLLNYRLSHVVPKRMQLMEQAILDKDFPTFGDLTMKDSNQFHAVCLDTAPPIFYMNESSKRIVNLVHAYNDMVGSISAAYTFDAGPNAVIYVPEKHMNALLGLALHYFSPIHHKGHANAQDFMLDKMNLTKLRPASYESAVNAAHVKQFGDRVTADSGVHQIIVSKLGAGPEITEKATSFGGASKM